MQTLFTNKKLLDFAKDTLGFDDCRVTTPFVSEHLKDYERWIVEGQHGDMDYLEKHLLFKLDPNQLLPGVKSAIVVIKNYNNRPEKQASEPLKVARYAVGRDYHQVIGAKLKKFSEFIEKEFPGERCYYGVDSRPLAERTLALKAGLGFLGKNAMVIQPGLGSYFFIGTVLTTLELPQNKSLNWDCGQCRLCLDACPTQAITPFQVDATQCISYLTVEKKEPLTQYELQKTQGWIFGCDICQEVCPYNHTRIPQTNWEEFHPKSGIGFDFFSVKSDTLTQQGIPKQTSLYRSRKRIIPNWLKAHHMAEEK